MQAGNCSCVHISRIKEVRQNGITVFLPMENEGRRSALKKGNKIGGCVRKERVDHPLKLYSSSTFSRTGTVEMLDKNT